MNYKYVKDEDIFSSNSNTKGTTSTVDQVPIKKVTGK